MFIDSFGILVNPVVATFNPTLDSLLRISAI